MRTGQDGVGGLIQRYVPGAGLDDYAAYTVGTGGSITRTWPITDPLGSVAAQTNSANVATQINAYDEYGVPQAGFSGRFGYAGAMFLDFAGPAPWHMRNRQYHPTLGRFMQTDPIGYGDGLNLYAYVGADPVNAVDPWGLQDNPTVVDEIVVRCNWWCRFRAFLTRDRRSDVGIDRHPITLGLDWASGTGPTTVIYGAESSGVEVLRNAPDVNEARCEIAQRYTDSGGIDVSYTDVVAHFGLNDYFRSRTLTEHYTGTYTIDIYIQDDITYFTIYNRSSVRSALGGTFLPSNRQPPLWDRREGMTPFGNTYQYYSWAEGVPERCD